VAVDLRAPRRQSTRTPGSQRHVDAVCSAKEGRGREARADAGCLMSLLSNQGFALGRKFIGSLAGAARG